MTDTQTQASSLDEAAASIASGRALSEAGYSLTNCFKAFPKPAKHIGEKLLHVLNPDTIEDDQAVQAAFESFMEANRSMFLEAVHQIRVLRRVNSDINFTSDGRNLNPQRVLNAVVRGAEAADGAALRKSFKSYGFSKRG